MNKYNRQKLIAALTGIVLSLTSPLLLARHAWAKAPADAKVAPQIEKLKTADEFNRDETVDNLAKLGAPAIPTLINALQSENLQVRQGAAVALGKIGEPAIPDLIKALHSKNQRVRWHAAAALGSIDYADVGGDKKDADAVISALIKLLKDPDVPVRRCAAGSLSQISQQWQNNQVPPTAKEAIPQLRSALQNPDVNLRRSAAVTLANMRAEAKDAIPDFIKALKDRDAKVRFSAIDGLGRIGLPAKDAVPELRALLKQDADLNVRFNAAWALGKIGVTAASAVPDLREALKNDPEIRVRYNAAYALGLIGPAAKDAIPDLREALKNPYPRVRYNAAYAFWFMGTPALDAIPDLRAALKDPDPRVFNNAAEALGKIAASLQDSANTLPLSNLDKAISELQPALKILEENQGKFSDESIANLRRYLSAIKEQKSQRLFRNSLLQNPWLWGSGMYLFSLFGLFAVRPIGLLKIYQLLKPIGFKVPILGADVSLGFLIFLKYHPRVLDAWVASHIQAARQEFPKRDTVSARKVIVPVPAVLDNKTIPDLTGKDLRPTFAQKRGCLLIWGEGGAGKTSRACQIAKWAMSDSPEERICNHRMLPVIIEQELNFKVADGKQPFLEAIRGQLQDLTDEKEAISEELLERLLLERRILVIVDRLSEMSEATQAAIRPEMPDFPVNALLVTSRLDEPLGCVTKTTMKPLRIAGNRLSSFMEGYLAQRGKRDLFTDEEFFKACIQLSRMVGDRNITVLLTKLYADQMVAAKEGATEGDIPDNIPELMLYYLNQLNRSVYGEKLSNSTLHEDAITLAWECLKSTFRPAPANREDAIAALGGDSAESRLKYLEEKLRLIQAKGVGHDQISFSLDPVAEYLAGLHLVEMYGKDESKWVDFLVQAEAMPGEPAAIKGFLLAVRDCYLAKIPGAKDTDFVPKELKQLGEGSGMAVAAPQPVPV
ncbi:HEAT repeat domain-containing protein [Kamptonema formosum]|uniref:HEAT repeat domain-containing protein n=1 Tax=Kamptonema formosum TaxID=331992 RepID=UPI000344FA19|nr:HEAT repeat domain-containing protein [Oscillatoria sp. PCC 10802]